MKTRFFAYAAMAAALAVSCSKQEPTIIANTDECPIKVTASFDFGTTSKVDFAAPNGASYPVQFKVGDSIAVYNQKADYTLGTTAVALNDAKTVIFKVKSVDATGKAVFEPSSTADLSKFSSSSNIYLASLGEWGASSPTNFLFNIEEGATPADNVYYIQSLVASSNYVAPGTIDNNFFTAYAIATKGVDGSINFQFKPIVCYIKLTIPEGLTIGKIRFNKKPETSNLSCFYQVKINANGDFLEGVRSNGIKAGGATGIAYFAGSASKKTAFPAGTYYLPICPDGTFSSMETWTNTAGNAGQRKWSKEITTGLNKIIDLGTIPTE